MRGHAVATVIAGVMTCALVVPAGAEEVPASTAGATSQQPVELAPTNERLVVTYRWPRWVPWTVFGVGVAVGGLGALVKIDSSNMMSDYDQAVATMCSNSGCDLVNPKTQLDHLLVDHRELAETRGRIGLVMLAGGGVAVVTGIVLVVLNRPERHVLKVDLVPSEGGASATVGWRY